MGQIPIKVQTFDQKGPSEGQNLCAWVHLHALLQKLLKTGTNSSFEFVVLYCPGLFCLEFLGVVIIKERQADVPASLYCPCWPAAPHSPPFFSRAAH